MNTNKTQELATLMNDLWDIIALQEALLMAIEYHIDDAEFMTPLECLTKKIIKDTLVLQEKFDYFVLRN